MPRSFELGRSTLTQRWARLLTASAFAVAGLTTSAEDASPPSTFPPELLTGPVEGLMPPDMEPQSRADLERTRSEAYGQALTTAQQEQIDSWRTNSVAWWRDHDRMERAHNLRADLADQLATLSGSLSAEAARSAFLAHPDTFGARITPIVEGTGFGGDDDVGTPAKGFQVEVKAHMRPDFFALDVAVADLSSVLLDMQATDQASADALFYAIFPSLAASDDIGDEQLIVAFWATTEQFVKDRAIAISTAQAEAAEPAFAYHRAKGGSHLTTNAYQQINRVITNARATTSRDQFELYMTALPDEQAKELLDFVTQQFLADRTTQLTYLSLEGVEDSIRTMKQEWAKK